MSPLQPAVPAHAAPRILLDLSTSRQWRGRHPVGIVRTEREVAARLLDDPDLLVLPVVFHEGALRAIDTDTARALIAAPTDPAASNLTPSRPELNRPRRLAARLLRSPITLTRLIARNLLKALPAPIGHDVALSLIHARQAVRQMIYRHAYQAAAERALASDRPAPVDPEQADYSLVVHPGPDDILFLCGLGWDVVDWTWVVTARRTGGLRVAAVVYDLIPVIHSEFLGLSTDYFLNYFLHLLDLSDQLICISDCTRRDLLAFAAASGRTAPPADVVLLGADMPAPSDPAAIAEAGLLSRLGRRRFALTVGTFEVRKNHRLLIDLWHELVTDPAFDLDLVIVGMPGWRVDDVIARLQASPLFGTRIFWLRRLPDAALSWLYDNCHVMLFPSFYEGWGLPVVEALQHGRPVIASNRGATPEAGLGAALLLDPEDPAAWGAAIRMAAATPRQSITVARIPDWDTTAREMKSILAALTNRRPATAEAA